MPGSEADSNLYVNIHCYLLLTLALYRYFTIDLIQ